MTFRHNHLSRSLDVAVRERPSGAKCRSGDEDGKSNARDSWRDPPLRTVALLLRLMRRLFSSLTSLFHPQKKGLCSQEGQECTDEVPKLVS